MSYKLTIEVNSAEELLVLARKLNGATTVSTGTTEIVPEEVEVEVPAKIARKRSPAKKKEEAVATPDESIALTPGSVHEPVTFVEPPKQTQNVADFSNVFQPPMSEVAKAPTKEDLIATVQKMVAAAASLTQAQQGEIISSCYSTFAWPVTKKLGECTVEELSKFIPTFRGALASKGINT